MAQENTVDKTEKTYQFLIELLKHSSNGKVDWREFIKDMDITTVNAAKKRFKRMMEPHGITERSITAFTTKDGGTPKKQTPRKKKMPETIFDMDTESNKSSPTKKRKIAMVVDPVTVSEDDGGLEEAVERSRAARAKAGFLEGF